MNTIEFISFISCSIQTMVVQVFMGKKAFDNVVSFMITQAMTISNHLFPNIFIKTNTVMTIHMYMPWSNWKHMTGSAACYNVIN